MYNQNENRLKDIKELVNEANEISERIVNSNLVACADEDRISDILADLFNKYHIDWLIEQSETVEGLQREIKKCYRDIEELQEDKRDIEKIAFDLEEKMEQLRNEEFRDVYVKNCIKLNQLEKEKQSLQYKVEHNEEVVRTAENAIKEQQKLINHYETALFQIAEIGKHTYKTESEIIAEKALREEFK
jgi:hypothetical protein